MLKKVERTQSFDKSYVDFHKILLKFVALRINNKEDAADLVQEVFLKAAQNMNSLRDDDKVKSWLLAIARNAIIDYYRKRTSRDNTIEIERLIETLTIPEEEKTEIEIEKCLTRFIYQLPKDYREIIEDSEIKGIKQKDLASKYGIAYPTVRSRIQRGRIRLKEMFLRCCQIELDRHGNVLEVNPIHSCDNNCKTKG
ncbi:RNA polymerase sigma factor SigZ [Leptospira biflexa]|uniref:RNA polymerase sigma factor SigZ n=1 Tax=Leptospira biflexa TaxID=172 RepID=UPI0010834BFE|nr:RNA polymerase sigma factor SigZ [Leptospira biflexa]TGM34009.1 RNA polymerase sigma factor SigZ [Leptospira biflexa]TGM39498.1 RNA polymerase sigma factor SigZ [Leptospira biflexa]TGM41761.1 RNA polymerase sigma factor SigZ [Leptospira biflexa]TGM51927.1 RNA polymerase sigma factor SigZ [Leptospira biflexa]